jgi:hypothetical protein
MTNDCTQNQLNDAMRLPDEQRAELAAALIERLDPSWMKARKQPGSLRSPTVFMKLQAGRLTRFTGTVRSR